jgi:uncharacterized protein involved in response to NO
VIGASPLGEVRTAGPSPQLGLLRKGFRPFFLMAAIYATAIMPAWLLVIFGVLRPTAYLDAPTWHAHEMIFGYVVAVISGFLLTAVGNWTQRETVIGGKLLALAALWALGRVTMAVPAALPRGVAAAVDLAFVPVLIVVLARPLFAARSHKNLVMLAVLAALAATNGVMHLEALGIAKPGAGRTAAHVAIEVVAFLSLVIAGRIIPMFTRNATGASGIEPIRSLDIAAVVGLLLLIALDVVAITDARITGVVAGAAGIVTLARAARWGIRHTGSHPLLWILHAGYGWIGIALLLRAAPVMGLAVAGSLATHALTVGAIGALTLGMMARVALGHTGRPLRAPPPMKTAFALITLAALARVAGPLLSPETYTATLVVAGVAWTFAFAIYVVSYAPILVGPRVDGKEG